MEIIQQPEKINLPQYVIPDCDPNGSSSLPSWYNPNLPAFVTSLVEIPNQGQNINYPRIYKVRYWNSYRGEEENGSLDNGEGFLILPSIYSAELDQGKLQLYELGKKIEKFDVTVYLRGGISLMGELTNDEIKTVASDFYDQLAQKFNQVVFWPNYPSSLTKYLYYKNDPTQQKSAQEVYDDYFKFLHEIDSEFTIYPGIDGCDDLLWNRFSGIISGMKVLGFLNIRNIIGVSSGAGTALLLIKYSEQLELKLPSLNQIISMAPPLDFESNYNDRENYFKAVIQSHIPINTNSFQSRSVDIIDLASQHPSVMFNILRPLQ